MRLRRERVLNWKSLSVKLDTVNLIRYPKIAEEEEGKKKAKIAHSIFVSEMKKRQNVDPFCELSKKQWESVFPGLWRGVTAKWRG